MEPAAYQILYEVEEDHWWFVGRRKIIETILRRELGSRWTGIARKSLDIGCGTGRNINVLKGTGLCVGIDSHRDVVEYAHRHGLTNILMADFRHIPLVDSSMDLVTALDTLEHIVEDDQALREIHRVLKPGGHVFIFAPAFPSLWGKQDDISHHVRRYQRGELEAKVLLAGFSIKQKGYANFFMFLPIWIGRKIFRWTRLPIRSESQINFPGLNSILKFIFCSEAGWLAFGKFPFGVSVYCLAQKPAPGCP